MTINISVSPQYQGMVELAGDPQNPTNNNEGVANYTSIAGIPADLTGAAIVGNQIITGDGSNLRMHGRRNNKIAVLGDSFDQRSMPTDTSGSLNTEAYGIWNLTNMLMQNRLDLVYIDGASGTGALQAGSSSAYRSRLAAAIATKPDWLALRASVNDFASTSTFADIVAEYTYLFQQINNAGIKIISNSVGPSNSYNDTTKRSVWSKFNQWILNVAPRLFDIVVLPQHYQAADKTVLTGAIAAAMTDGSPHPNLPAAFLIAQTAASVLDQYFPNFSPGMGIAAVGTADETVIDPNPLNIGSGTATSMTLGQSSGTPTSLTPSIVSRTDGPGNWQQAVWTPDAINRLLYFQFSTQPLNAGVEIGDIVQAFCEFEYDAATADADVHYPSVTIAFTGTSITSKQFSYNSGQVALGKTGWRGVVATPKIAVPAGCTGISAIYIFVGKTTGAKTVRYGQHGILNHSKTLA